MKHTNVIVIPMMSLLMVACGGGGDASTPDPVVAVVDEVVLSVAVQPIVIDTVEPELDPDAIYDTTAELVAAKSFLLEHEYELAVSYQSDERRSAYLSVCTEFTEGQYGIKVNYNSCLLRTSIEGDYAGTLKVSNDKSRLVMAIWYLDEIKKPRYEVWENNENTKSIKHFDVN